MYIQEVEKINMKNWIEAALKTAIIGEVETTPKPGLVDLADNGAHKDMSYETFVASANAIVPYLVSMFDIGYENSMDLEQAFLSIRQRGIEAEKAMFLATHNINTHKGIIFSLGILSCCCGIVYKNQGNLQLESILDTVAKMTYETLETDFMSIDINNPKTFGEKLFIHYGDKGIRGEVQSGFSSVRNISLPLMIQGQDKKLDDNYIKIQCLLALICQVSDTNVLNRGGETGQLWIKERALELLAKPEFTLADIRKFNEACMEKNISPGGSADLLAVTLFLYDITKL